MKLRVAKDVIRRTHDGVFPFPIFGRPGAYWRARRLVARKPMWDPDAMRSKRGEP